MNNIKAISVLIGALIFTTQMVSAQAYYPSLGSSYPSVTPSVCVNLSRDLSMGMRSSDVTSLQTFLVNQNFPGGGSWMITGYFGAATLAAVRDFQQLQGMPESGIVDSTTRSAIARVSCGNSYAPAITTYPYTTPYTGMAIPWNSYTSIYPSTYSNNYLNNNTYPYNYSYNNLTSLNLTSLSQNTGFPGQQITIYGTGFDPINNTVYFGSTVLSNISSNGTSLTFTIPGYGTFGDMTNLYVTNSRGTSNTLTFTLYGGSYGCNTNYYNNGYGYLNNPNSQCGCQSNYNNVYPYNNNWNNCNSSISNQGIVTQPTIMFLNPNSGGVGASVSVMGSGFTTTGNTVHFGNGIISNLNSTDGQSVSFIVPTQLVGFGTQLVGLGTYNVSVTNGAGFSTNVLPFTVTSLGSSNAAPTITGVTGPTTLAINTQGVWTVMLNNNQNNSYTTTSVNWGDQTVYGAGLSAVQTTYAQGNQTLTFTHTYQTSGTYTIIFTVSNVAGQQNTSTVTVNVTNSGTTGNVTLSYLSPTSGHVGTQVMLQGSGFNQYDNTVHFGNGGTLHVPSQNGTTIYYTIPYSVSPCDLIGSSCGAPSSVVTLGSYPIYVTNSQGTTQTLNFQVQ